MIQTRERIVEAADRLFYERGFGATSFADIAGAVGLSRGNFYYHFQAKDEILTAVIERRLARTRALLADWEAGAATPAARLRAFIGLLRANRAPILAHGCPVGTLCNELVKLRHAAADEAAALFALFRDWLAAQFAAAGRVKDAEALALRLLALSQGVATLASALRDPALLEREVAAMDAWLRRELTAARRPARPVRQR